MRSSSATGQIRDGEFAVSRSRRRDALVAQKNFLQKATKETKPERPLTADQRPRASVAKAADEKADLVVSGLRFVVLLFIRAMRGQKFRKAEVSSTELAKKMRIVI